MGNVDSGQLFSNKLSGKLRRPEDFDAKHILIGKTLRSNIHQGKLLSIETPPEPTGLVSVRYKDIAGTKAIKLVSSTMPILTGRNIFWKGQPILLAAGPSEEELNDWISRVKINVKEREEPEVVVSQKRQYEKGNLTAAFQSAFFLIEESVDIQPQNPSIYPPLGAACQREGTNYLLHLASNWPGAVRRHVAKTLDISQENVRIRPYSLVPGLSLGLCYPVVEACRAALLAQKAKKSIRLFHSPEETRLYGPGFPGAQFFMKGALNKEGRLIALEANFTIITGACVPLAEELLDRVALALCGIYRCRHLQIQGQIQCLDAPPSSFSPAAGLELGFLAAEIFSSRIAENKIIASESWKGLSFTDKEKMRYPEMLSPRNYALKPLLEIALQKSDFERKNTAFEQTRRSRNKLLKQPDFYRGIGLSKAWFGHGFVSSQKELNSASITATFNKEGQLIIDSPSTTASTALRRNWELIASDIMGIDPHNVHFKTEISSDLFPPGPTVLGRNIAVYTRLLEQVCDDLAKRRFRDPLPITVSRTRRRPSSQTWHPASLGGKPFEGISWGVSIVEVAVSTQDFLAQTTRIWLFIDSGRILRPESAKISIEAATEQTLRWCQSPYQSRDSKDFSPALFLENKLPLFNIYFHEQKGKNPPRDVSTLPWVLLPAAYMQALSQAVNKKITHFPVLPEHLFEGEKAHAH